MTSLDAGYGAPCLFGLKNALESKVIERWAWTIWVCTIGTQAASFLASGTAYSFRGTKAMKLPNGSLYLDARSTASFIVYKGSAFRVRKEKRLSST